MARKKQVNEVKEIENNKDKQELPEINDNFDPESISTPEIDQINVTLKSKMKPSERMRLTKHKQKLIRQEMRKLGMIVEDSDEDGIDDNNGGNDVLKAINMMDDVDDGKVTEKKANMETMRRFGNTMGLNMGMSPDVNPTMSLNDSINGIVSNSLEINKNPNNQHLMSKLKENVSSLLQNVISGVVSNDARPTEGNNVDIYVRNHPDEKPKLVYKTGNTGTFCDIESIKKLSNLGYESGKSVYENLYKQNSITDMYSGMNKRVNAKYVMQSDSESSEEEDVVEKVPYQEPEVIDDKLDEELYEEVNNDGIINGGIDLAYEESDEELDIEDSALLDIDTSDFDKFKEMADKETDVNNLMVLMDRSIKKQIIREKNMQYVSKRIKQIVIKNMGKDLKECQKKTEEKTKKKTVRGGINNLYNINNSLCNLLKYPKGSKKSWTQVTADLWKYISENKLQDPDQKKMVNPNDEMKKCFGIKKNSINMMDMPSYLSNMFKNRNDKVANDVNDLANDIKDVDEDDIKDVDEEVGNVKVEEVNEVEKDVKKQIEKSKKVKKN